MTASVPTTLEELLHALVEACVEEIAAARHEFVTERAAAAAERRELEQRIAELEKGDDALRVTLPNGIEVQTETTAEADALLDWLMSAPELVTGAVRAAKRGPYSKHNLGPVQSKIVEALKAGPLQHRELAEVTGAADRNLRYTLLSMTARGLVVRGWNQLRQVVVYALPGVELPPVPEDRPHKGVKLADEVTKAPKVGSVSPKREADPEGGKPASNEGAKPEPTAPRRFDPRGKAIDFKGVKVGTFEGVEPTSERRVGAVVWIFRCTLCGEERRWSSNNVNAIRKKSGSSFRCVCQGGSRGQNTGRAYKSPGLPVRHVPVGRPPAPTSDFIDDRLDELDPTDVGGDDLDGLLERSMREAEGDGRIRALAARAARPRDAARDEDEERDPDDEGAENTGDEHGDDEDGEEPEELDFG